MCKLFAEDMRLCFSFFVFFILGFIFWQRERRKNEGIWTTEDKEEIRVGGRKKKKVNARDYKFQVYLHSLLNITRAFAEEALVGTTNN